jgi:hypothetical protein
LKLDLVVAIPATVIPLHDESVPDLPDIYNLRPSRRRWMKE